jgi:hypothetical protein
MPSVFCQNARADLANFVVGPFILLHLSQRAVSEVTDLPHQPIHPLLLLLQGQRRHLVAVACGSVQ